MKTITSFCLLLVFLGAVFFKQPTKDPRRAVASITFYKNERPFIHGTGWFLGSTRQFVTVHHVVRGSMVRKSDWTKVTLCTTVDEVVQERDVKVRWIDTIEQDSEDLVVLELDEPFPNAQTLNWRTTPLPRGSKIRGWGYKDRLKPQYGHGVFYNMALKGFGFFRLENSPDKCPFDCGSSGSPLLDDKGDVVAVISKVKHGDIHPYILLWLYQGMPEKDDWTNMAVMIARQE